MAKKCWISCNYVAFERDLPDGGYLMGLRCKRCKHERLVAKVSPKGAELQKELEKIRRIGYANVQGGYNRFIELQETFRREVKRI